jgi:predicted permease
MARGRGLTAADHADAPLVALVNETMARTLWPGADPLGRRFRLGGDERPWTTVVGVVRDVRSGGLREPAAPEFYVSLAQFRRFAGWTRSSMTLVVRTAGDPARLAPSVRRALAATDPELAAADVRTMRQVVDRSVAQPRFTMLLLSTFGGVALLLAAVGVYGVISYGVAQRTREFGIRTALGARRADVLRLVLGQGLGLAALGVGLGLVGALAATRALRSLVFAVRTTDPATYAAIAVLLLGVAALASLVPARRATRADPTRALRQE